jgi:DNA invertase Pin-like site-specific DNA recombinase
MLYTKRHPLYLPPDGGVRAALYMRMSTDRQLYSIESQIYALAKYARENGLDIVDAYADEGRSGLTTKGRFALQELLRDVQRTPRPFEVLLVLDVSRWGRFQNIDESAYYDFLCHSRGVQVIYCAESFANDPSPMASVMKSMRRVMAGEYSRDLSRRIAASKIRRSLFGGFQGATTPIGLRRAAYDSSGAIRQILEVGEQRAHKADRINLVLGPAKEVRLVRRIYRLFVTHGYLESEIAATLNKEGVLTLRGSSWVPQSISWILKNAAYTGVSTYNQCSPHMRAYGALHGLREHIRAEGAFPAIVSMKLFAAAAEVYARRPRRWTDEGMLRALRRLYARLGHVSKNAINAEPNTPRASSYRNRFKSLLRAYRLAGVPASRVYKFEQVIDAEIPQQIRKLKGGDKVDFL